MIHKSILIKQNGFYSVDWDLETNQPTTETQVTERLSSFFGYFAEFDENITVGNLMLILGDFSDEINLIFNGYLNVHADITVDVRNFDDFQSSDA